MLGKSKATIVVYVDRNRLQFFGGGLSAILALEIPVTIVKDLDVVNRDALYTLVNQWLQQNNLGGANLFFVLSANTYFEAPVTATTDSQRETEILAFYDRVPFEELTTKIISLESGKRALAMNKLYMDALRHAFFLQGLHVVGAIPAFLLGSLAAKRWLDAEMGGYVLKHIEVLKEQSVLETATENVPAGQGPSNVPTTKSNPRLMIMVSIFGVLLLVLVFVIFSQPAP